MAFIAALPVLLGCSATSVKSAPDKEADKQALVEAEAAFLKSTSHAVTKYVIRAVKEDPGKWVFRIEGIGEFGRPGYQWWVIVDKATHRARVLSGE